MKCPKCGFEHESRFCPECGTPAVQQPVQNIPPVQQPFSPQQFPTYYAPQPVYPSKKKNKVLVIILTVLLALLVIIIIAAIFGGKGNSHDKNNGTVSSAINSSNISSIEDSSSKKGNLSNTVPLTEAEIAQMYTDPIEFAGRKVELIGVVFTEPQQDSSKLYLQVFTDIKNHNRNTVVTYAKTDLKIKNGDYVKISGVVYNKFEGKNAYGGTVTGPSIIADKVEVITYTEAVSPTIKEVAPSNPTIEQNGYSITISKIEFAENETRVYVKVKNAGDSKFSLYSFNAKILQNGKQYEEQTNYEADYPKVQTDLLPGAETEGIIAFPKLELSSFQLVMEGSSENYSQRFNPYSYDVSVQ